MRSNSLLNPKGAGRCVKIPIFSETLRFKYRIFFSDMILRHQILKTFYLDLTGYKGFLNKKHNLSGIWEK